MTVYPKVNGISLTPLVAREIIRAWFRFFPKRAIAWLSSPQDVFDREYLGHIPYISPSNRESWDVVISLSREVLTEFSEHHAVPVRFLLTSSPKDFNADAVINITIHYSFHFEDVADLETPGYDSHPKSQSVGYLLGWGPRDLLAEYLRVLHSAEHNMARIQQDLEILLAERQPLLSHLEDQKHTITLLTEQNQTLQQVQKQQDVQITGLQQENSILTGRLEECQQEKDRALEENRQYSDQITSLYMQIDHLQNDLRTIHNSPSWKFLSKIWRIMAAVKGNRRSV